MKQPRTAIFWGSIALAAIFWAVIFGLKIVNFWAGMAIASVSLAALSMRDAGIPLSRRDISLKNLFWGAAAAVVLYAIFAAGNWLSRLLFDFAGPELSGIYAIGEQGNIWVIALVLLCITSPAEEIFWRGFVQRWCQCKAGGFAGWILGGLFYAGVHIASCNLMLTLAALVAGLFWGFIYWRTKNLFICIVSHAFWTVAAFVLWPFN